MTDSCCHRDPPFTLYLLAYLVFAGVFFGGVKLFMLVSDVPDWWGDYLALVAIAAAAPLSVVGVAWLFAMAWKGRLVP